MSARRLVSTHWRKRSLWIAGLLVFSLLLAGCVDGTDWGALQRQASVPAGDLYYPHTLAQSLVANHAGLNGLDVVLVDYGQESGLSSAPLELRLCHDLACSQEIAQATIPPEAISHNSSYRFSFPAQANSAGRTFFLQASVPQAYTQSRYTLWAHDSDRYPEGSLFYDGEPSGGDLNFWAHYEITSAQAVSRLLQGAWFGLPHLGGLLLLLLAPGYLLARLLPRSRQEDVIALAGLCVGLSVAVVPVLLLLLSLFGGILRRPVLLAGGGLLGALALALLLRDIRRGHWRGLHPGAPVLVVMVGIVSMTLVQRAVHTLGLVGPLWVDAVHHALVARLIVEQGAIPTSYLPFVQAPATYHFGFQSLVAALHSLSGISLPASILWVGQALSGLSGLPLYALGRRWGKSPWAGVGAAAIPSVFSLMPAYYVSWSRYTELLGLCILPVAVLLFERWLSERRWHLGLAAATGVAIAGTLVAHLRVGAFFVVLAGLLLIRATVRRRYQGRLMAAPWIRTAVVALAAALLIWSWLWPSIRHLWIPAAQLWPVQEEVLSLGYVLYGAGRYVAPLAALGTAIALLRRRSEAFLLFLWVGLLPLMANPRMVGLQAGGPLDRLLGLNVGALMDDTAVAIASYVPVSLMAGLTCGELAHWARRLGRRSSWWRWAAAILLIGLSLWGAYSFRSVVNPVTAILTQADLQAMPWIEAYTAPDAVFLINSYQWMSGIYAGNDGGYWISPLAGRRTWPPPALYGLGSVEDLLEINRVAEAAMAHPEGEELYDLLRGAGITHIYIGRYGGPLAQEKLITSPHFHLLYQKDGVCILSLEP